MEPQEKQPEIKEKIYWAPAKKYVLHLSKKDPMVIGRNAEFCREQRDARGNVIQKANPIEWGEHTLSTDDPEVIAVIENSVAFENGDILECESEDVARAMTLAKSQEMKITSGMVTMLDEAGNITSAAEALQELNKSEAVTAI